MTFPTTSVIDAFTRANGSLGTNYTDGFYGDGTTLAVISNTAGNTAAAWAGAYYNVASYGPDAEIYFDAPTSSNTSVVLWLRAGGTLTGNPTGYYMTCNGTFGSWSIRRADGTGSDTQLGAAFTQTLSSGDSLGFSAVGSTLTAYYKASGGSWTALTTRTDSTYSSAGKLALEIESNVFRLDNFGGGTVVTGGGTTYPVNLSATVTFTASTVRQVGIKRSGTVTLTPSIVRQVGKNLAQTVSFTGSVQRAVGKTLSQTITFTPSISYLKAILKTLTATVTFSAGTQRQVGKNLAQTITFTPSVVRQVGLKRSATVTFTASTSYLKAILKSLSATVTFSASTARQVGKNLSGTVSFTPSMRRAINKTLNATVTFTPSVTRVISKKLSAAVSFTATLAQSYIPFVPAALVNGVTGYSKRVASYLGHSVRVASYVGHSVRNIVYRGYSQRKKD